MATRKIFDYDFSLSGAGATTNVELDALDLSRFDALELEINVATAATDTADTLNVYLQSRGPSGIWEDRIATAQFLGDQSDAEVRRYVLQQFGTLADSEEASEPVGSAGGSHLTAGTVKNGAFPGPYRTKGAGGSTATAWRLQFVTVDADEDSAFTGTVYVSGNSGDLGVIPRSRFGGG